MLTATSKENDFAGSMAKFYRRPEWIEYRAEMIELDESRCRMCGRGTKDGVILQVHHTVYIKGRMPWDYPYDACETLCKRCHAEKHGLTKPSSGWTFLSQDDLGELCGACEYCGTPIRHVFFIGHPSWGVLAVGTDCCDRYTGTLEASTIISTAGNRQRRLETFKKSPRWHQTGDRIDIRQKGMNFEILPSPQGYRICFYGFGGKKRFPDLETAKEALFAEIESGKCEIFLKKKGSPHLNTRLHPHRTRSACCQEVRSKRRCR